MEDRRLTGRLQQRQEGDSGSDLPDDRADLILNGLDGLFPGSAGKETELSQHLRAVDSFHTVAGASADTHGAQGQHLHTSQSMWTSSVPAPPTGTSSPSDPDGKLASARNTELSLR